MRDGLRGASPRVTELPEESADGKAVYTGTEEGKKPKGEGKQVSCWQGREGTRDAESRHVPSPASKAEVNDRPQSRNTGHWRAGCGESVRRGYAMLNP